MGTNDRVLIQRVVVVKPRPGTHYFQPFERRDFFVEGRPYNLEWVYFILFYFILIKGFKKKHISVLQFLNWYKKDIYIYICIYITKLSVIEVLHRTSVYPQHSEPNPPDTQGHFPLNIYSMKLYILMIIVEWKYSTNIHTYFKLIYLN